VTGVQTCALPIFADDIEPVSLSRMSSSSRMAGRRRGCASRSKVARELRRNKDELDLRKRQRQKLTVLNAKYRQRLRRASQITSKSPPVTKIRRMTSHKKLTPDI